MHNCYKIIISLGEQRESQASSESNAFRAKCSPRLGCTLNEASLQDGPWAGMPEVSNVA